MTSGKARGALALLLVAVVVSQTLVTPISAAPAYAAEPFTDTAGTPFEVDIEWLVSEGIAGGYPDGTFRPTSSVTRQAFAAFLFRLDGQAGGGPCASGLAPFIDIPATATFCTEITWLVGKGITAGYSDGTFRAGAVISRQAIAAFLYRYDHSGPENTSADGACTTLSSFSDVSPQLAFCEAIRWMSSVGEQPITTGFSDGRFAPTAPASRQAVAAWLHRYRAYSPVEQSEIAYVIGPGTIEMEPGEVLAAESVETPVPDANGDGFPDFTSVIDTTVTLAAGTALPTIGSGFVVPPGSPSIETGLAGVVESVTYNPDDSLTVTLVSAPLEVIFESLEVSFDGPVDLTAPIGGTMGMSPAALLDRTAPGTLSAAIAGSPSAGDASLFECKTTDGAVAAILNPQNIQFLVDFQNMRAHYEFRIGSLFESQYINFWIYVEPVVKLTVKVAVALDCKVNGLPSLGPFLIAGPISLKLSPYIEFKVSGAVSFNMEQRFYRTAGLVTNDSGGISPISNSSQGPTKFNVAGTITVTLSAGAKLEVGVLDRIGFYLKVGPKITAKATAVLQESGHTKLCLSLTGAVEGEIGAYLDIFVAHWTWKFGSASIELSKWETCVDPEDEWAPTPAPSLTRLTPRCVPLSGGQVSILGSPLADTSSISVDGTAATSLVIVSNTNVTVVVPAKSAGAHVLSLATSGGLGTRSITYSSSCASEVVAVPDIDAGYFSSFELHADGSLSTWGYNVYGQLGDGTETDRWSPTLLTDVPEFTQISAGYPNALAVTVDGDVYSWGHNNYGQLGDGTLVDHAVPAIVPGLSGIVEVSAGGSQSLARTTGGQVYSWGHNTPGELPNGVIGASASPVLVASLSGVIDVETSGNTAYALTSDGRVYSWGVNLDGSLGTGSGINGDYALTPVPVAGLTDAIAISSSGSYALALRSTGTIVSWGNNMYGQLGDGTTTSRSVPTAVGGLSSIIGIAAGVGTSLAIRSDGTVAYWGVASGSPLQLTPITVAGLTDIVDVDAGSGHLIALDAGSHVYGWGYNPYGQVGDGTTVGRRTPVLIH